eukprot:13759858-Alexandrium_andersonii.AAC.1
MRSSRSIRAKSRGSARRRLKSGRASCARLRCVTSPYHGTRNRSGTYFAWAASFARALSLAAAGPGESSGAAARGAPCGRTPWSRMASKAPCHFKCAPLRAIHVK